MAWVDDRIWCHPKLTSLTDSAFRTYVQGLAYSSGMGTGGALTRAQIRLVSSKKRDENELVFARLWDSETDGIRIHDWKEHNGKRDERRAVDRERKRLNRAKTGSLSAGHTADKARTNARTNGGQAADKAADKAADRRTLTGEGSDLKTFSVLRNGAVDVDAPTAEPSQPALSHEQARKAIAERFGAKGAPV